MTLLEGLPTGAGDPENGPPEGVPETQKRRVLEGVSGTRKRRL